MDNFADFLYTLRKEKGLTQAELAERLGVTNKAVSKWETGEAMPETALLVPLARELGTTVDELLNGGRNQSNAESPQKNASVDGEKSETPDGEFMKKYLFKRAHEHDEPKTLLNAIKGIVCAAVFFIGLAAYLIVGIALKKWTPYWVIVPVGALSCGIVGIIFDLCDGEVRKIKKERGEHPVIGAVCGLIMLTCIIVYLLLGALLALWHPYWIIVVCGAIVCGIVGSLNAVLNFKNKK